MNKNRDQKTGRIKKIIVRSTSIRINLINKYDAIRIAFTFILLFVLSVYT